MDEPLWNDRNCWMKGGWKESNVSFIEIEDECEKLVLVPGRDLVKLRVEVEEDLLDWVLGVGMRV